MTRQTYPYPEEEHPTGRSDATMRVYAGLIAAFDSLGDRGRTDLAEIACLFADSTPEEQELLLRVIRALLNR